jgi:uncharacterized LabA/DUF88 family protein
MEPLKTAIFIDGSNFKNNLQAFHFYSDNSTSRWHTYYYALDEKHFLWDKFFSDILTKFSSYTHYDYRLVRVYWYSAASIRPFEPFDYIVDKALAKCQKSYPELTREQILSLAGEWYKKEKGYFEIAKDKIYRFIQDQYTFIEFKYIGEYVVKPFEVYNLDKKGADYLYQGTKEGEKGVDVGIAVDMITKMAYYDVAILISGDADFIPIVCHIKDHLKYVYQFSIAKGIPPKITYLSPFLRGHIDSIQHYNELELLSNYINRSTIPREILLSIDKQITHLSSIH